MPVGSSEGVRLGRGRADRLLGLVEDGLYALSGVFLAGGALTLFVSAALEIARTLGRVPAAGLVVIVLDRLLLVFMLAELMHTVRVSIRYHVLAPEPFLIVGLIAAIRRVLVISAEVATVKGGTEFERMLAEVGVLSAFILAVGVTLLLLKKAGPLERR